MSTHRNPRSRVSNKPHADNFNPGDAIERLYVELVEVEALARAAGEAVTELPSASSARLRRIFARLYTLVTKTAIQASAALTLSESMVSRLSAHMAREGRRETEDLQERT
jgi:hypothetical protein